MQLLAARLAELVRTPLEWTEQLQRPRSALRRTDQLRRNQCYLRNGDSHPCGRKPPNPLSNIMRIRLLRCSLALLVAGTLCAIVYAHGLTPGKFPLARDASAQDIVAGFSIEKTCHLKFLEKFKLTRNNCGAKLELARKNCAALIVEGLPEWLQERQLYTLMGRSRVCLLSTIWGQPYNREAADHASEAMWKKDGNGG